MHISTLEHVIWTEGMADFEINHLPLFISIQVLDVAVSLAKVADVDKSLGDEKSASDGFQEAIDLLESLTLKSEASGLEQRVCC